MHRATNIAITPLKHRLRVFLILLATCSSDIYAIDPVQKTAAKKSPYVATNKDVLAFTKQAVGTKVGRGECWDLAQQALDFSGSIWRKPHQFGFPLKKGEEILPGDIIQFASTRFEWSKGNGSAWKQLGYPNHTSIIYGVKNTQLQLAHQNVNGVRKVFLEILDLKHIVSGSYKIYRPYKRSR